MRKLFKWLLLSVVVLAIGTVIILYNPGIVRGPLERYLSGLAGYSITLEGKLNIDTGRLIEVSADDIRISAPGWARHEDLVAIGHMYLALDTASIFRDSLLIELLQVDRLRLNLETNADGTGNWPSSRKTPEARDERGKRDEREKAIVIFKDVEVSDATLRFRNGKTSVEHVFDMTSLKNHQQSDGMLHTVLNGKLNGRPVAYSGSVGPYVNLLNGRDVTYNADGHFGELALKGHAVVDNLFKPRKPTFNLDLQGPDIDEIAAMLGIGDLGSGDFSLHANGAWADGSYRAGIKGEIGDISLDVSARTTDLAKLDELDLAMAANGPNLDTLTRVFGIERWPDQSFSLKGDVHKSGSVLNIPGLTMQVGTSKLLLEGQLSKFPGLDDSRVKLTVTGDDIAQFRDLLNLSGPARGPFELKGVLDVAPDGAELLNVELTNTLGKATISGSLGPAPAYTGTRLDLKMNGDNANSVMAGFGLDILPKQPFELGASVELVKDGLKVEKEALLTVGDERLQMDGLIGFGHGGKGTDLQLGVDGKHLAQVIGRYAGDNDVPDGPFELGGRVRIVDEGLQLSGAAFEFRDILLKANGTVKLDERLSGTTLDFDLDGGNLSSLKDFRVVGDTLDIFVAGQPYHAAGRFEVGKSGWKFSAVDGQIGKTAVNFDLLISHAPDLDGSSIRISAKGPELNQLLVKHWGPSLPAGAFETGARINISGQTLHIEEFNFQTKLARARVNLELGWPLGSNKDVRFDAELAGDDIRRLLPDTEIFEAEKAAFQIDAVGRLQGKELEVDRLNADIGNLSVFLKGSLTGNSEADAAPLTLNISSPDLSKIGQLDGQVLPSLAFDFKGSFKGDAEKFALHDLSVALGESRLAGELDVSLQGPRPDVKLVATSKRIDIRPFLKPGKSAKEPAAGKNDRLIPDIPIPLERLAAANLDIHLNVDELIYPSDRLTNLNVLAETQGGKLDVRQFSYDAPRGKLNATLSVIPDKTRGADVKLDLDTKEFAFNFSGLSRTELEKVPAFDIDLHVSGNGAGLREVAGSLNGSLYVGSKGGSTQNVNLGLLDAYLLDQIFSSLMPKSNRIREANFSCIAAIADISDGLVQTNPALAFNSEKIMMVAKGTLNLKTEALNINFNATPTNVLKINATEVFQPYLVITGTLANPVVGVDPGKAVIAGGAAIATMGTPQK